MAHKQIYYSDKYFDEHYEYRAKAGVGGRCLLLLRAVLRSWVRGRTLPGRARSGRPQLEEPGALGDAE
ncbi:hypothetical protein P7K49_000570 [Saguinus oedipus]|uniref:Uncharacterized protein n=1 Tax=Saguinus oedipus TaxID=9490 RepID=A0ABQ9WDS9_SAGOE|nr:hypothetical protein P7K49_000570 [Saguinus oedipus]